VILFTNFQPQTVSHFTYFPERHAVAQLVEALDYKQEDPDSRWCHWIFSLA